jgi:multiple antibiotic resistance protein
VAGAVAIASLTVAAILSVSPAIFAFLGRRGALAMERLMGMLLVMLSVQMILDGIGAYLQHVNGK